MLHAGFTLVASGWSTPEAGMSCQGDAPRGARSRATRGGCVTAAFTTRTAHRDGEVLVWRELSSAATATIVVGTT
jgi:hypothetical protein